MGFPQKREGERENLKHLKPSNELNILNGWNETKRGGTEEESVEGKRERIEDNARARNKTLEFIFAVIQNVYS